MNQFTIEFFMKLSSMGFLIIKQKNNFFFGPIVLGFNIISLTPLDLLTTTPAVLYFLEKMEWILKNLVNRHLPN
jgi:hypothetical protein